MLFEVATRSAEERNSSRNSSPAPSPSGDQAPVQGNLLRALRRCAGDLSLCPWVGDLGRISACVRRLSLDRQGKEGGKGHEDRDSQAPRREGPDAQTPRPGSTGEKGGVISYGINSHVEPSAWLVLRAGRRDPAFLMRPPGVGAQAGNKGDELRASLGVAWRHPVSRLRQTASHGQRMGETYLHQRHNVLCTGAHSDEPPTPDGVRMSPLTTIQLRPRLP